MQCFLLSPLQKGSEHSLASAQSDPSNAVDASYSAVGCMDASVMEPEAGVVRSGFGTLGFGLDVIVERQPLFLATVALFSSGACLSLQLTREAMMLGSYFTLSWSTDSRDPRCRRRP